MRTPEPPPLPPEVDARVPYVRLIVDRQPPTPALAPEAILTVYEAGFVALIDGGSAGPGGYAGFPGEGGHGGAVGGSAGGRCPPPPERHDGADGRRGNPGTPGNDGQPGEHFEDALRLIAIEPADFEAALARTAIISLVPNPAKAGDLIT